jgi:hypothetical protein
VVYLKRFELPSWVVDHPHPNGPPPIRVGLAYPVCGSSTTALLTSDSNIVEPIDGAVQSAQCAACEAPMIDLEKVKAAAARAAHKAVHGTRAKQFLLRLPDGIHERIAREAAANHRSMNAEIVYRLQAMRRPTTL